MTCGLALHVRLWIDALSLLEEKLTEQLKFTTRCSTGGCGYRVTYLVT